MKRIFAFLLSIVVLMGVVRAQIECDPSQSQCEITIWGHGVYSDSWMGLSIEVWQGETLRGTFTLTNTSDYTQTFMVCSDSVRFVWRVTTNLNYPSECQFRITNANDSVILSKNSAVGLQNNQVIARAEAACRAVTCPRPRTIWSEVDESGFVRVVWNNVEASSNYMLEYGLSPYTPTGEVMTTIDTFMVLADLLPNRDYDVILYAYCGVEDTSETITTTFHTPCGEATIPLTEGFENNGLEVPGCWTLWKDWAYSYGYGTSHGFRIQNIRMYAHTGDYYAELKDQYGAVALASPLIPVPANQVEVFYHADCWQGVPVEVGYITSLADTAQFHLVQTQPTVDGWVEYHVSFADVAETRPVYVVFRVSQGSGNVVNLDDITIRALSNCADPQQLRMTGTASGSVDLAWNDTVNGNWELAGCRVGATPEEAEITMMNINDPWATVYGLEDDSTYDFYVRASCGGSYSYWVGPLTLQPGVMRAPYQGCDTVYLCGATVTDHAGPNGEYDINCESNMVIYPENEGYTVRLTGTYDINTDWDKLYLYEGVGTEGRSLGIYQGTGILDTVSTVGPITLRFASNGSGSGAGFALTVSCEEMESCPQPYELTVSDIAPAAALLSWNYSNDVAAPDHFAIKCRNRATGGVQWFQTTDHTLRLTGLTALTTYEVALMAVCGEADTSQAVTLDFTTQSLPCLSADLTQMETDSLWYGTKGNNNIFGRSNFNYSVSQQLFHPSEMSNLSVLTGMKFRAKTGTNTRILTLYLANTSVTTLSGFVEGADLTEVWSDTIVWVADSVYELTFATPFNYDNSGNLLLMMIDSTGSWTNQNLNGVYVHEKAGATYYSSTDSAPFDPTALPTSGGSATNDRINVIWSGHPCGDYMDCVAPNVLVGEETNTTIALSWIAGYNEPDWEVAYKEHEASTWIIADSHVTAQEYLFTNLTPNTSYDFRVTSNCGGGESAATEVTAATICNPVTALPFEEHFDNGFTAPSNSLETEPCWNRISSTTAATNTYPRISPEGYDGGNSIFFYGSRYDPAMLVLPVMGIPVDSLQVTFACKNTATSFDIQVGVMTDPEDVATFQPVATLLPSAINTWEQFEVNLDSYEGTGRYIAFSVGDGYKEVYIDAIYVDYIPNCPRPHNLQLTDATLTTADIRWVEEEAVGYTVEYGPHGFAVGTGTTLNTTEDSIHLTGLTHSTMYDIYVRSHCDSATGPASFVYSFMTECGTIATLPYMQNFDDLECGTMPLCWEATASYPRIVCNADRNGSGHAIDFNANAITNRCFSLPALEGSLSLVDLQTSISVASGAAGSAVVVGICTVAGDLTTFVPIDTVYTPSDGSWYDTEVPLGSYVGTGTYITYKGITPRGSDASVYIDEISVEVTPNCLRPDQLAIESVTATTANVTWSDPNGASQWLVEYGQIDPTTQQINNSTIQQIITTTTHPTLTGLSPHTEYCFRVRAICGGVDTSYFSRTRLHFTTSQVTPALPYEYDFEDGAEWANWQQVVSRNDVAWYRGTATAGEGSYSMYVSADNGASVSTQSYAYNRPICNFSVYRDFDFGQRDTSVSISFKAKCGGLPGEEDGLYVFLANPAEIVTAPTGNNSRISPWGDLNNLTPLQVVRTTTSWDTYAVEVEQVQGVQRLVFCFFNKGITTSYVGRPAEVDSIAVRYTTCPRPIRLEVDSIGTSTAQLSWSGDEEGDYEVSYRSYASDRAINVTVHGLQYLFSSLDPSTRYVVKVRKICGEGDTSLWCDNLDFNTACGAVNVSASHPLFEGFEAPTAPAACWTLLYANNDPTRDPMVHTTDTVYAGTRSFRFSSWNSTTDYNQYLISPELSGAGEMNLSFYYRKYRPDYEETMRVGYSTSTTDTADFVWSERMSLSNISWEEYRDTLPAETKYVAINYWANYKYYLYIDNFSITTNAESCYAPDIVQREVMYDSVALAWNGTAQQFEYGWKRCEEADFGPSSVTAGNNFSVGGLDPETCYLFRVRKICSETMYSDWTYDTIMTAPVPCFTPQALHLISVYYDGAEVDWTPVGVETQWEVSVFNSRIGTLNFETGSHPFAIDGLQAGERYGVAVRALCNEAAEETSSWSDTVEFITTECQAVSDVACGTVSETDVMVSWTVNGEETAWIVEYGMPGFGQGEEIGRQEARENPYAMSLAGLEPNTDYEVYVYAQCSEGLVSVPAGPASFRTSNIGIPQINTSTLQQINIYPNPTTGSFTISISSPITDHRSPITIDIVDMNGRIINSTTQQINNSTEVKFSGLPQGAYFVRIYGDTINVIRKLIVK